MREAKRKCDLCIFKTESSEIVGEGKLVKNICLLGRTLYKDGYCINERRIGSWVDDLLKNVQSGANHK